MLPVVILPYVINFSGFIYIIPVMMLTFYYNFLCIDLYRYKKNKFDLKKAKKSLWLFYFIFVSNFCIVLIRLFNLNIAA